jgi:hypothetical protein
VDYHVGVMLAHGTDQYAGALYTAGDSAPPVLDSDSMNLSSIGQEVAYRINNIQRESATSGGEAGMYSVYKSLTTNLAAMQAQGFYRSDAALAVVFITNEWDICAPGADLPAGTPAETNPVEISFFNSYCGGVTSSSVLAQLRALKGNLPLKVGGILFSNPNNIPSGLENEIGYGPLNIVQEAGADGFIADMANLPGIAAALAPISTLATSAPLQTKFYLKVPATMLDYSTLAVYVNGVKVTTWTYDPGDSSITLSACTPGLGPCACIEIKYCEPCPAANPL